MSQFKKVTGMSPSQFQKQFGVKAKQAIWFYYFIIEYLVVRALVFYFFCKVLSICCE